MTNIEEILRSNMKPKGKQTMLVEAVISGKIPVDEFIVYFEQAKDVDKGTCADVMKHSSAKAPALLAPYIDILIGYINHPLPRVKWGVPETIGNLAKNYPDQVVKAIPYLLLNTTDNKKNTTVIKWCAAFALGEIAKYNPDTRKQLILIFKEFVTNEKNTGVKNVYKKALTAIEKEK